MTRIAARLLWLIAFVFPACVTVAVLETPVPFALKLAVLLTAVLAASAPGTAMPLLGALTPIAGLWGAHYGAWPWTEALVIGAWAGWTVSRMWKHSASALATSTARVAAVLFGIAAMASGVSQLGAVYRRFEPGTFASGLIQFLTSRYFIDRTTFAPLLNAAFAIEGVVLFVAAVTFVRPASANLPRLLRMLALGATASAAITALRLLESALRSENSLATFGRFFTTLRYSALLGDVNAAGSFYVLALLITSGLGCQAWSESRRGAFTAFVAVGLVQALGLWWTGSRTAVLTLLISALVWGAVRILAGASRRAAVLSLAGIVLVTAAASVAVLRYSPNRIDSSSTLHVRAEMARTALRLTATAPWFGIGIGRFYERSPEFIHSPWVKLYYSHENAHNNYLQILAELGIIGAALFVWWLGAAVLAAHHARTRWDEQGLLAGIAAFLLTCLTGHPLLVREVAYPFWIALGAATAAGAARIEKTASDPRHWDARIPATAAVAISLVLIASVPPRARFEAQQADLEHLALHTSTWRDSEDGMKYRQFSDTATFFVPTGGVAIWWQMRTSAAEPVTVNLRLQGKPAAGVTLWGASWQEVRMIVPAAEVRYAALEMQARTASGTSATVQVSKINSARASHE
jgi:O-antigen ligase